MIKSLQLVPHWLWPWLLFWVPALLVLVATATGLCLPTLVEAPAGELGIAWLLIPLVPLRGLTVDLVCAVASCSSDEEGSDLEASDSEVKEKADLAESLVLLLLVLSAPSLSSSFSLSLSLSLTCTTPRRAGTFFLGPLSVTANLSTFLPVVRGLSIIALAGLQLYSRKQNHY